MADKLGIDMGGAFSINPFIIEPTPEDTRTGTERLDVLDLARVCTELEEHSINALVTCSLSPVETVDSVLGLKDCLARLEDWNRALAEIPEPQRCPTSNSRLMGKIAKTLLRLARPLVGFAIILDELPDSMSNQLEVANEFATRLKMREGRWLSDPSRLAHTPDPGTLTIDTIRTAVGQVEDVTDCLWSYKTVLTLAASGDADLLGSLETLHVGEEHDVITEEQQQPAHSPIKPLEEAAMAVGLSGLVSVQTGRQSHSTNKQTARERMRSKFDTVARPRSTGGLSSLSQASTTMAPSTTPHSDELPPKTEPASAITKTLERSRRKEAYSDSMKKLAAYGRALEKNAAKSGFVEQLPAGNVHWFQEPDELRDPKTASGDVERMKVVTVGDGATGKTCFYISYTTNKFPSEYVPTIFDNYSTTVKMGDEPLILSLFDTAGQEDYDRLRPLSYLETDVFIITYCCNSLASLANVEEKWVTEIRHHCPGTRIMVVGLQEDLRRDQGTIERLESQGLTPTTYTQGCEVARSIGACAFAECSALNGQGLQSVFETAIKIGMGVFKRAAGNVRRAHGKKGECILM